MSDARQRPSHGSRPAGEVESGSSVFGSSMAEAVRRTSAHFAGRNASEPEQPDAIELWGRRIGRALSLVVCVGLGLYLYLTYLR